MNAPLVSGSQNKRASLLRNKCYSNPCMLVGGNALLSDTQPTSSSLVAERSEALNQGSILMMCGRMYVRTCPSRLGMLQ